MTVNLYWSGLHHILWQWLTLNDDSESVLIRVTSYNVTVINSEWWQWICIEQGYIIYCDSDLLCMMTVNLYWSGLHYTLSHWLTLNDISESVLFIYMCLVLEECVLCFVLHMFGSRQRSFGVVCTMYIWRRGLIYFLKDRFWCYALKTMLRTGLVFFGRCIDSWDSVSEDSLTLHPQFKG